MITTFYLVQDAPYPPRSGSPLRAWQNINLLAALGPVHVYSVGKREPDASMPIAASWTHVDAHDFPSRAASPAARLRRALRPREFPIENDFIARAMNRWLREAVERHEPDVIVVSHWHHALPRALRGRHVLIADAHNVEAEIAARDAAAGSESRSFRSRYRVAQARRRERSYLRGVDAVWATSDRDAALFAASYAPLPPVDVLPNAIDLGAYAGFAPKDVWAAGGPTIGYVGFFGYRPNADAAQTLIDSIFPAVAQRRSDATLLLVGRAPTEGMKRAARAASRIIVTGEVDDVREALARIDILAVPLTNGSGTRMKILEAFAARIPVVTTAKGIEGIAAEPGVHAEVCSPSDIADRCVALLENTERRKRLVEAAYALVTETYSWKALAGGRAITRLRTMVSARSAAHHS